MEGFGSDPFYIQVFSEQKKLNIIKLVLVAASLLFGKHPEALGNAVLSLCIATVAVSYCSLILVFHPDADHTENQVNENFCIKPETLVSY